MQTNLQYFRIAIPILLLGFVFTNCISETKPGLSKRDTSIIVCGHRADVLFPSGKIKGSILVLPGWNFKCDDVCKKSDFCEIFTKEGYALIMPDMLKSVYSSKLYPETRKDWLQYPTINWLLDSLIPFMQKEFKLLLPGENNYLFGISTGGRGVALMAESSNLFVAGAALSGDYNQLADTSDNLMKGYYGPFYKFQERWKGRDNPSLNIEKLKIALYLAHGKVDNIVPVNQTIDFYNKISKAQPQLCHEMHINESAKHEYGFWESEYKRVLEFFGKHKSGK